MAATLKASSQGLKLVDDARNKKGWNKYDEAWSGLALTSEATLKRFWQGVPISKDTFISICDAIGLSWEEVIENDKILSHSHNCFAIIEQGVSVWNKWRQNNYDYRVNLNGIDLRGYNLSNINLRDVSFKGADLSDVNLSQANLSEANLTNANFIRANLRDANLSRISAINTNFVEANLTGCCLEDWNINSKTKLDNIVCDYIYFRSNQLERRPSDPNRNFESGEFAALVQKSLKTVDLIFNNDLEKEVPLLSKTGVDYTKLRDLLAAGEWKEADRETRSLMLKIAGLKQEDKLDIQSIRNFPCTDLRTIDTLWVKYSNGHFGFSVQKRIWSSSEVNRNFHNFIERVGWARIEPNRVIFNHIDKFNYIDIDINLLTFNLAARKGQLPMEVTYYHPDKQNTRQEMMGRIFECDL